MPYRYAYVRFPFHERCAGVKHHFAGKTGVVAFAYPSREALGDLSISPNTPVKAGISYCSPEDTFSRWDAREGALQSLANGSPDRSNRQNTVTYQVEANVDYRSSNTYKNLENLLRSGQLKLPNWLRLWFKLERQGVVKAQDKYEPKSQD